MYIIDDPNLVVFRKKVNGEKKHLGLDLKGK